MPTILAANHRDSIELACQRLTQGVPVAVSTETVYGLAADATNGEAVAKIFALKNRPSFNPLISHVSDLTMAKDYARFNSASQKLAEAFWPGPLTLIVDADQTTRSNEIHSQARAGLDTIGLRAPQGFAHDLIVAFAKPLAAPSANLSGRISPTQAQHVADDFVDNDLLIIDDGAAKVGLESTIVKAENDRIILLRPGGISAQEIAEVVGLPVEPHASNNNDAVVAPGQLASHYAPRAELSINCSQCADDAVWLGFGNAKPKTQQDTKRGMGQNYMSRNLSVTGNLIEAAANLYAMMLELDQSGAVKICVAPIPEQGLGIAINDRLRRAAAPRPD